MAVYKVPQDVEADDKLIGPFSFRQFIYLVIVVIAMGVGYLLSTLFIGLAVLMLPVIVLFGALALPLRKDQPMEMYLLAVIRFFLKPRLRMWQPDGSVALVQIVAPKMIEEVRGKDISQDDARNRLEHLAQLMDTRGWSAKGITSDQAQAMGSLAVTDADITNDIMDGDAVVAKSFDTLLAKRDAKRQEETRSKLDQLRSAPQPAAQQETPPASNNPPTLDQIISEQQQRPRADFNTLSTDAEHLEFNPYPNSIHQHVVQPVAKTEQGPHRSSNPVAPPRPELAPKPVTSVVSPDIMRLATESGNAMSVSTLAKEAHRLQSRKRDDYEVDVSLR